MQIHPMVWQVWFNFFTVGCGAPDSLQELISPGTLKLLELSSAAQRPCSETLSHLQCCRCEAPFVLGALGFYVFLMFSLCIAVG